MDNSFEINTATGVDLQLSIAGPGARSYAFFIDWHFRILFAAGLFVVLNYSFLGSMTLLDTEASNFRDYIFAVWVPVAAVYLLYHPVLEILMRGRTPGKRIAGVRIVALNGQLPGALALLIRNILRLVDSLPAAYVLGLVVTMLTRNAVRIGDLAAGTVLIYDSDERSKGELDPELNAIAVSRFGIRNAELAQELLRRWDELEESKRINAATRLLAKLAPELQPETGSNALARQLHALLNSPAE